MADSISIDVEKDDAITDNYPVHSRTNRFSEKVTLERTILVTNIILELPSAVFDQLSSVHKPKYALISMLMSLTVLIISIIDLVYKGRKERVIFMMKGLVPWFYYPYPNSKPFGRFADIIGLVCAFFQCVFASLAYAFLDRHESNPVNLNVWPVIFAFGLLCSRFSENLPERMPTHFVRKKRYRDLFVADAISYERHPQPTLVRGLSI